MIIIGLDIKIAWAIVIVLVILLIIIGTSYLCGFAGDC
ncbi:sporulation protein YjcZ (plasmid) [Priestia megaterium]